MTIFLDRDAVLEAGSIACGFDVKLEDVGLLESAVARPRTTVFGDDAYPTLFEKAAALLHSLACNHVLQDGNKRTAWGAAWVFLAINGIELNPTFSVDDAYDFMIAVTTTRCTVDWIASKLNEYAL